MESVKRGYEPKDAAEFGTKAVKKLNAAAAELFFLLNRGYDMKSASTFIGNHHLLSERQRMALARAVAPSGMLAVRSKKQIPVQTPPDQVWVDGFNIIITLEVALSGSLLLLGMDGTIRDLAGLRGTYRIVDKTEQAVRLFLEALDRLHIRHALIYLDQPVSNSGRLRGLILQMAEAYSVHVEVELAPNVDGLLRSCDQVISSDAIILNHCVSWMNLARHIIEERIPEAWIFHLDVDD